MLYKFKKPYDQTCFNPASHRDRKGEDIVKDYVQLKTRGHSQIGLCPFHKERTPSFTVYVTKNLFKCYGCGKGGDGVKFIMEIEQLSFVEAVRFLARKYNIQLEELASTKENLEAQQSIESLNLINDWAKNIMKRYCGKLT
ncbi:MAG: hypothetical protein IPM86_01015 [Saprospiraceae bacterium]|nr:hypothetical protein [Saprospiraceae bacterium]